MKAQSNQRFQLTPWSLRSVQLIHGVTHLEIKIDTITAIFGINFSAILLPKQ